MPEYIERQAAINKIRYREKTYGCVGNTYSNVIKNLPAADVVPVKHGHWAKENLGIIIRWNCSACWNCYYLGEPNAKYCPNCGAKMISSVPKCIKR